MGRNRNTNHKFYLPEGDAETIWHYCQYNALFKKPEVDYLKYLYVVHTITAHCITHHLSHIIARGRNDERYKGCPLNVRKLATILGVNNGRAGVMLGALIDMGVIKRIGGYTVGFKSYCYVLCKTSDEFTSVTALPKYAKNAAKFNIKCTGTKESSAIKLYKKELQNITLEIPLDHEYYQYAGRAKEGMKYPYSSSVSSMDPTYSPYSIPSYSVPIHSSPMMGYFNDKALKRATSNTSYILQNNIYESTTLDYVSIHKTKANIIALQAIIDGDWFVHRPDPLSRVHTNLINLNRYNRPLLRYDGKPFVELDIRNSQPLIASILIRDYWTRHGKTIPPDVIQYQLDCEAGTFYDYFMDMNSVAPDNRQGFKIQMFGEVFFSKVSVRSTRLKKQFISKYPSAYEAICDIKGGLGSDTYNQFAILLQQKEASIIFDIVNIGLLKDDIPAFNIFDSILCLSEHKAIARERLITAFAAFNITPMINYKEYNESITIH